MSRTRPAMQGKKMLCSTCQAFARGDDMCYMVVIPSIRLYRFEVGNILGEVQDTINRRYGIYLHHSDLTLEQAEETP